ncbi:MAG: DNA helicase UvrD, partial [Candidatus Aenigmatarchaeota archaeon]
NVLLEAPQEKLKLLANEKIADVIMKNRSGKIRVQPGYDGEYGFPLLDDKTEVKSSKIQRSLRDF